MIGAQDLWLGLALGVFFFGSKKLPELSRSLGQALSEFKKGVTSTEAETSRPVAPPKPEETPPDSRR
jgi:TatA/E family protein of Tat protein translocase